MYYKAMESVSGSVETFSKDLNMNMKIIEYYQSILKMRIVG